MNFISPISSIVALFFIISPQQPQFLGAPSCPKTCFTRSMGVRLLAAGGAPLSKKIPRIFAGSDFVDSYGIGKPNMFNKTIRTSQETINLAQRWKLTAKMWITYCSILHYIRIFSGSCCIIEVEKYQ